ncbi:hypothetical protein 2050HW_00274 [Serratia phage vB_SmaM_ 2050HW]|uniref:Uncharacterized protein n=2 Tax=Moabitevirus TaxID=2843422 RepID=A0A289YZE1_9CAUD|nr:hypothetical protein HWB23_gp274 [Serratia phage vB_SmaM_ 2050HW]ATA65609.1 hypothetical protein 2050HW_00274 [Serratia phage vB_SmaM_ 2050HW]QPX76811.1 putative structural head protein [Serratia phage vB_SmaM_Yaphecito]UCR74549.1 hypothetical protein [Serratia phage BUCT660]UGO54224.1 hypothetical protein HAYMO_242 [Serratia phage vB_SmaM_Haymo]
MEIKQLFDSTYSHISFDPSLAKKINTFVRVFMNKGEHSAFFGSGLLAAHKVRWTMTELKEWFDNIAVTDMDTLKINIDNLDNIDPNHIVTTDAFNLTTIYFVHRVLTSDKLNPTQKTNCAIDIIRVLHFKFICGILTQYFPYGTDPQIALRTYEAMSYKYDLKQYKTWAKLIEERAKSIIATNGIHYESFIRFNDDDDVKYILSDIQTRIRVVIKTLTALYYQVKEAGDRVIATSTMVEVDGSLEVRDVKRLFPMYRRYLNETITDTSSFVKPELVDLISKTNPSLQPKLLTETLTFISTMYSKPQGKKVKSFVERTLEYTFDFIHARGINPQNLAELISGLKGVINASRNKEPDVMFLRTNGDDLVRKATGRNPPTPVSSERTGVILYIVLRTVTMKYYQAGGSSHSRTGVRPS